MTLRYTEPTGTAVGGSGSYNAKSQDAGLALVELAATVSCGLAHGRAKHSFVAISGNRLERS